MEQKQSSHFVGVLFIDDDMKMKAGNKKRKKFWNKFNHFDIRFSISIYYNSIISVILFSDSDKPPYLSRHKARQWWNLWFEQIIITNICYGELPNHCDVNRFAKSTFSFQFFFSFMAKCRNHFFFRIMKMLK